MPKNIVMCFDGTDNSVHGDASNVLRLYECLEHSGRQLTYYDPGVGTLASTDSKTGVGRFLSRTLDGAIGHSLRDNFCEAYRFLAEHYKPGDAIFLYGFSRGAYTARAVAAGVHAFGLVKPEHANLVSYVWSLLLNEPGLGKNEFLKAPELFKSRFCQGCVPIHFVGVWDTVSSLGWIWDFRSVPYTAFNPSVHCIRHAVSIDERRAFFRSNLFCFTGKTDAKGKRTIKKPEVPGQDLKEVWFAGAHSDVGGGYPDAEDGLAKIALDWMIRESQLVREVRCDGAATDWSTSLHLDQSCIDAALGTAGSASKPSPLAMQHHSLTARWWLGELFPRRSFNSKNESKSWRWPNFAKRRTVAAGSTVHASVVARLKDAKAAYRPKNLPKIEELLVET